MAGSLIAAAGLAISPLGGAASLYVGHGLLVGLFGISTMLSPLVTYVSLWFDRRQGAAVALISSGQAVAGAIWPLILDAAIRHIGWRATMQAYAIFLPIAVAGISMAFLREPPEAALVARGGAHKAAVDFGRMNFPRRAGMACLMLAIFCCCVPMNMPIQHIVAFCGDLGISSQQGALMLSVLLGSALIARQFWGYFAVRFG
jgi:hypothetical protein